MTIPIQPMLLLSRRYFNLVFQNAEEQYRTCRNHKVRVASASTVIHWMLCASVLVIRSGYNLFGHALSKIGGFSSIVAAAWSFSS